MKTQSEGKNASPAGQWRHTQVHLDGTPGDGFRGIAARFIATPVT